VTLANFYDVLIDNPNSPSMMDKLLSIFLNEKLIAKEFTEKCTQHVKALKKQIEEEYAS